jgi:hypothetical protein
MHTLDGLAIGPKLAQPIATAIAIATPPIPLAIPTAVSPVVLITAPLATLIDAPTAPIPPGAPILPSPPPAQYLYPSTANTDPAMRLYMD